MNWDPLGDDGSNRDGHLWCLYRGIPVCGNTTLGAELRTAGVKSNSRCGTWAIHRWVRTPAVLVPLKAQCRDFPVKDSNPTVFLHHLSILRNTGGKHDCMLSSYHEASRLSIISLPQLTFVVRTDSCRTFCLCSFQDKIVSVKDKHPAFISIQSKSILTRMAYCSILLCLFHSATELWYSEIISKVETRLICSEI